MSALASHTSVSPSGLTRSDAPVRQRGSSNALPPTVRVGRRVAMPTEKANVPSVITWPGSRAPLHFLESSSPARDSDATLASNGSQKAAAGRPQPGGPGAPGGGVTPTLPPEPELPPATEPPLELEPP